MVEEINEEILEDEFLIEPEETILDFDADNDIEIISDDGQEVDLVVDPYDHESETVADNVNFATNDDSVTLEDVQSIVQQTLSDAQVETEQGSVNNYYVLTLTPETEAQSEIEEHYETEEQSETEAVTETEYNIDDLVGRIDTLQETIATVQKTNVIHAKNVEQQNFYLLTGVFALFGGFTVYAFMNYIRP